MTEQRDLSLGGLETCGYVFDALARSLRAAGLAPDTRDLPHSGLDENERLVLAYLLHRSETRAQATGKDTSSGADRMPAAVARDMTMVPEGAPSDPEGKKHHPATATESAPPDEPEATSLPIEGPAPAVVSDAERNATQDANEATPSAEAAGEGEALTVHTEPPLPLYGRSVIPMNVTLPAPISLARPNRRINPKLAVEVELLKEKQKITLPAPIGSEKNEAGIGSSAINPRPADPERIERAVTEKEEAVPETEAPAPAAMPDQPEDQSKDRKAEDMAQGPGSIPKVGPVPPEQPERISLPNARSNTPYNAMIEGYSELRVRDDAGTGIVITADGHVFAEKLPTGEHKLEIGALKNGRPVTLIVRLSVVPRPEDLWVSLPSDQEAPLAKPDQDFASATGDLFVAAASKRGRSHAKEGSYRDDHFALRIFRDIGWHIMIVADGAGSAKLSREGSRVAALAALDALKTYLPEISDVHLRAMVSGLRAAKTPQEKRTTDILRPAYRTLARAAYHASTLLEERANELQCQLADLSTTLTIAAARRVPDGWLLASYSIGDGAVAIWDAEARSVCAMCQPDSGEFAGQTRFLSKSDFDDTQNTAARVFVEFRERFSGFFAMTDGITDPKFETDAGLSSPEKWQAFWAEDFGKSVNVSPSNPDLEKQFLDWLDFWSRGNHDDRTLAVMVPLSGPDQKTGRDA